MYKLSINCIYESMFIKVSFKQILIHINLLFSLHYLSVKHNVLQAVRPSDFEYFCRQQLENATQRNQA
mgnify:CR=1